MRASYLDILIIAIFFITLIAAYLKKFNAKNLLGDFQFGVRVIFAYIGAIITYSLIRNNTFVDKMISLALSNISKSIISPSFTAYIITIVIYAISIFVIYNILNLLLFGFRKIVLKKVLSNIDNRKQATGQKKSKLAGVILNIPTAIAYCLIIASIFILLDVKGIIHINGNSPFVGNVVQSFESTDTNNSSNPFKEYEINTNSGLITASSEPDTESVDTIVYYNGVTLNQAIKSDSAIDDKAQEIVKGDSNDIEKARALYNWIGNNITYNTEKANEITQDDGKGVESGAIPAFNTRNGVCFDYASLYVAMARDVGLKVRIVSGEGFTGTEWGPHAWNEVFIPSENKWIPVDTTFASSGDYFATNDFYSTHKDGKIIGQWN